MSNRNNRGAVLFLLMVLLVLQGCSNGTNNATAVEGKDSTKNISMIGWYEENIMSDTIDQINNALPEGTKLEYTFVNLSQFNNVLSTQLAAGEGPDIIMDGTAFSARIRADNLLEITNMNLAENFNEAGLSLASRDGKIYGVPSYGWFSGTWYNKDIFAKYNLSPPKTFEELLAICRTLTDNGIQPIGFGLSDDNTAWHSLMGYLENAFYHNGTESPDFDIQFAQGKKTMEGNLNQAVDTWSQMITDGYITSKMLGISAEQVIPDFIAGKTAMFYGGPWQYNQLKESGLNFGMFSHVGTNPEELWLVGGLTANFGINKNSQNIDAAKEVLQLLASENIQKSILNSNPGGVSYFKGLVADIPEEYTDIKDVLDAGRVGVAWERWGTNMPAQSLIDEGGKQLQGMIGGATTTEGFLKALDNKANQIRYKN